MTTGEILSFCSLAVAVLVMLGTLRRDTRGGAAVQAQTMAKLDGIASGVDDVRVEIRAMRDRQDSMGERLAAVEASGKSMHHRLDEHIANTALHPPDAVRAAYLARDERRG